MFSDAVAEIPCETKVIEYKECPAGGMIRNIRVARNLGDHRCLFGSSFGNVQDRIWIDSGCSALFIVTYDGGCVCTRLILVKKRT